MKMGIDNSIFEGEKTVHVYCTLANSQQYPVYTKSPQGDNVVLAYVHINGGAHRMHKKTLDTPVGMLTSITEKALEHLESCATFQYHKEKGFITVRTKQVDIEKAVADHELMTDKSRQLTPEDYAGTDPENAPIPSTKGSEIGKGRKVVTAKE